MQVAVIVLNYNSSLDCRKCVADLLQQDGVELDIVVVDNCSSSEERKKLETVLGEFTDTRDHKITYMTNNVNRGYNAGNNIGLRYASQHGYKYALVANPDMEFPLPDYIALMVKMMESDDSIAVQGTDIIDNDGRHQNPSRELAYHEELFWPIEYLKNRKSKKYYTLDHTRSMTCDKVSGCCLMIRLSFAESIGFFDENVFLYSEESILGAQVRRSGKLIYYNHSLYAIHRHIEKSKGRIKPRMKALFRSRWYYLTTYSGYSRSALAALRISKKAQEFLTAGL